MAAQNQPVWQTGTVVEATPAATGIRRIVVAPANPQRAAPGTHVDVLADLGHTSETRSYSIVESNDDGALLTLGVQLASRTRGGSAFMHALTAGERITMTQPLQNFPLRVGADRYVLLAGGIGITAIAGMARLLQQLGSDYQLVYAGRSRDRMAYLDALEELHQERIRVHVSEDGTSLDASSLVEEIATTGPAELYMCGPIPLMDAVRRSWRENGLPPTDLRYETFGNGGWFPSEDFVVSIPRLGIRTTVEAGQTMLQALERAGADVLSECRKGECGLCQVTVLDVQGRIDHRDVFFDDDQKQATKRLCACVSRAVRKDPAGTVASIGDDRAVLTLDIP